MEGVREEWEEERQEDMERGKKWKDKSERVEKS